MKKIVMSLFLALADVGATNAATEKAIVAGGCFWCVESDFESVPGVTSVVSGYSGGTIENPSYSQVGNGGSGHYEAVEITFDNSKVTYEQILHMFFRSIDPLDSGGQFCDRGDSYRTAIFVTNSAQKVVAAAARLEATSALGQEVATSILQAKRFWPAEDYHQDYYKGQNLVITRAGPKKQSNAYKFYRNACGRDQRVKELWGGQAAFTH
ncbi:MAG: peptide-methionine (S)-S-oxide reductase MsrA [Paracoccaceae bacterium]